MLSLLLWLAACAPTDTGKSPGPEDQDGDGSAVGEDCVDDDASIHPGATELCDGVDQDCDGVVDEDAADAPTWYTDADADGWGDENTATTACTAPAHGIETAGDCDDSTAAAHPGATEVCDGLDDDCDGETDPADAADAPVWYRDADGDTYGDAAHYQTACTRPDGWTDTADDCDDDDPTAHPGGTEVCGGGDEDCDGSVDEGVGTERWTDGDGDGYGGGSSTVACTGGVENGDDCDDGAAAVHPGATETCDGVDEDCDGTADDGAGSLRWADADGDGYGAGTATTACTGGVENGDDCDDGAATVHPGATETCDGVDEDCDGTADDGAGTTRYADSDGDGHGTGTPYTACSGGVAVGDDCDDADATAYPGATEVCGGGDEDCDGLVDEDVGTLGWLDADGDGYGTGTATLRCTGGVDNGDDCDDADASSHPGGTEMCGGGDEDCDGTVDVDATDATTWYADADHDGHGDPASPTLACVAPAGSVAGSDDCDDTRGDVFPGAAETCDDTDEDCDGVIDDGAPSSRSAYTDSDGDGWGDDSSVVSTCDVPEGDVLVGGDCDDGDAARSPGASEVCGDGIDQDCDGLDTGDADCAPDGSLALTDLDLRITGATSGDQAGGRAVVGDFDADGVPDLAVAAYLAGSKDGGAVAVWYGPVTSTSWATADVIVTGVDGDRLGRSLAAGDLDGDGVDDLAIGAELADEGGSGAGAAYVYAGGTRWAASLAPTDATVALTGAAGGDSAGIGLLATDVDGDGQLDLLVGATGADRHGADSGEVAVWFGPLAAGTGSLADADASIDGEKAGDGVGSALAEAGDVDGDGFVDLVLGAALRDAPTTSAGTAYVVYGPVVPGALDLAEVRTRFTGLDSDDELGLSVAGGDLDGDGYGDVVIGAPHDDAGGTDAGMVLAWRGPLPPVTRDLSEADVQRWGAAGDDAGLAVTTLDLDGDGRLDLASGSPYADPGGLGNAGRAAVFYGPVDDGQALVSSTADVLVDGDASSEYVASWLGHGDVDGDGYDDLLVGLPGYGAGELRVLYGGSGGTDVVVPTPPDPAADLDGDGWTGAAGDCDDTRATEHPGASEACGDGLDEDCDGADQPCLTTGSVSLATPTNVVTGTAGDGTGHALAIGDVDGDGFGDLFVGAWADDSAATDAGAVRVYLGPLEPGSLAASAADDVVTGLSTSDYAGYALATGDFDGDGLADLAVGAPGTRGGAGKVYLFRGASWPTGWALGTADVTISGSLADTGFAERLVLDGDLDGDGLDDLVLAVVGDTTGLGGAGAVYVFRGGLADGDYTLSDADTVLHGEQYGDAAGASVAYAGDVDGDGRDDLLVGATGQDQVTTSAGKAYLLYGPLPAGDMGLHDADAGFLPGAYLDDAGVGVTGGDFDGDGFADVVMGVDHADGTTTDAGEICVFRGPIPPTKHYCADADAVLPGKANYDYLGSVLAAGDVDGDGKADLVAGVPDNDDGGKAGGSVYLVTGPDLAGTGTLASVAMVTWSGEASDGFGDAVAVGDLDGDGLAEVVAASEGTAQVVVEAGGMDGAPLGDPAAVDRSADEDGDGTSPAAGDCDDTDATVHPGATDTCGDGVDGDCDGIELWCAPVGEVSIFTEDYPELYGESSTYSFAYFQAAGGADLDGDGDDDLLLGNSYWGGATDQGVAYVLQAPVRDGFTQLGEEPIRITGEAERDDFGESVAVLGDVSGDGRADVAVGASGNDDAGSGAGTVYVFFGGSGLASHTTAASADVLVEGTAATGIGGVVAAGDVDGDGNADLLVGSSAYDGPGSNVGAGLLCFGPWTSGSTVSAPDTAAIFYGEADNDRASSVAAAGDVDGDGLADFMTAAGYHTEGGASNSGKVYFYYGGAWAGAVADADADASFYGVSGDVLNVGGRAGDLDGDGVDEWFLYSYYYDSSSSSNAGGVWLMRGAPAAGNQSAYVAPTLISGSYEEANVGVARGVGDLDGDGRDDLALGAEYNDRGGSNGGMVALFYGDVADGTYDVSAADGFVEGTGSAGVGGHLAAAGDLDDDGYPDFWTSKSIASGTGYSWVVFGGPR